MCFVPYVCFDNSVHYGNDKKASLFEMNGTKREREREIHLTDFLFSLGCCIVVSKRFFGTKPT